MRTEPLTMRPGNATAFMIAVASTDLPDPVSPTSPTISLLADRQVDAVEGAAPRRHR